MGDQQEKCCMHCYVSGKVQGVWYRANTEQQARLLQLTGYAKNLPDGRVEVLACGSRKNLDQLLAWLKIGPELAKVIEVNCELLPWREMQDFITS